MCLVSYPGNPYQIQRQLLTSRRGRPTPLYRPSSTLVGCHPVERLLFRAATGLAGENSLLSVGSGISMVHRQRRELTWSSCHRRLFVFLPIYDSVDPHRLGVDTESMKTGHRGKGHSLPQMRQCPSTQHPLLEQQSTQTMWGVVLKAATWRAIRAFHANVV